MSNWCSSLVRGNTERKREERQKMILVALGRLGAWSLPVTDTDPGRRGKETGRIPHKTSVLRMFKGRDSLQNQRSLMVHHLAGWFVLGFWCSPLLLLNKESARILFLGKITRPVLLLSEEGISIFLNRREVPNDTSPVIRWPRCVPVVPQISQVDMHLKRAATT